MLSGIWTKVKSKTQEFIWHEDKHFLRTIAGCTILCVFITVLIVRGRNLAKESLRSIFVEITQKKGGGSKELDNAVLKETRLSATHSKRVYSVPELNANSPTIIERPLFDGVAVTVHGIVQNALSSFTNDSNVDILITEVIHSDGGSDINVSPAMHGHLFGSATPNMALKVFMMSFSELVSEEGRSYQVTGFAIDPESKKLGVRGDYSSGLGSRLLGIGIDRTITAADQIAMHKLMGKMTDDSVSSRELQRAAIDVNQQASMNLAAEATKELRETQPELSLSSGTSVTIKLKSASSKAGLR